MNMLQKTTLANALASSNRVPFSSYELNFTADWMLRYRTKYPGLQLGFLNSDYEPGENEELMSQGVFAICSHPLDAGFVFFKCNAGRGIFGNQKSVYPSFIHDPLDGTLSVGAIFKRWEIALTSIGNIYRGVGLA